MPKKKTSRSRARQSWQDTLFHNETLNFALGLLLVSLAIFMVVSFVSFFTTGADDMSLIQSPRSGDMTSEAMLFHNKCGSMGAWVSWLLIKRCFGFAAFFVPLTLLLAGIHIMRLYEVAVAKMLLSMAVITIWLSVTLAEFASPFCQSLVFCPGGDHGHAACTFLNSLIGATGLTLVLIIVAVLFLTYLSVETIYYVRKLLNPTKFITGRVKFSVNPVHAPQADEPVPAEEPAAEEPVDPDVFDNPDTNTVTFESPGAEEGGAKAEFHPTDSGETAAAGEVSLEVGAAGEVEQATGELVSEGHTIGTNFDPKEELSHYRYPTLDLLEHYETDGKPYIDMAEQTANKNRIVEVLRNFGVEINSIKATVGPTITLYEITPAKGVRISKIRNLEDDIALSLSALGIRIIAPIPGKGTIGIEVPNAKQNIVSMESILNSKKFQETTMALPCALGKTITNEVFMFDLAKSPHLLVAGATGQGKSVGLNAIITSLLYKKHPSELKIVLIDPKKVEFSLYEPIERHFLAKVDEGTEPIITDVTKVVRTLNSLCKEMDQRYDLLKLSGTKNIKEYNQKFIERRLNPDNGHRFLPYIVVVIDEFGDLIMTAGREVELPIARIAQLARAVGIHMVIATQRPTTTIITGNIKANFPARVAFKVSAAIDSKTILDASGANQLIGRGDLLYRNGGDMVRVQCAFVDTPEVGRICDYISVQQGYTEAYRLPEPDTADDLGGGSVADADLGALDPLFEDAARNIVLTQSGSTSLIQRKFSIGYNRAGRLMDQLEKYGVVGAASGSKPREVLIQDENSLNTLLSQLRK